MVIINRVLYKGDGAEFGKLVVNFNHSGLRGEFYVEDICPFSDLESRMNADLFNSMCEALGAVKLPEYGIYRNRQRLDLGYIEIDNRLIIVSHGEIQPMIFLVNLDAIV